MLSKQLTIQETVDCIRKFNARRKMKAAMTAVKLATVRKVSYPTTGMKSASGSDRSIKNESSSEKEEIDDTEKISSRQVNNVSVLDRLKFTLKIT